MPSMFTRKGLENLQLTVTSYKKARALQAHQIELWESGQMHTGEGSRDTSASDLRRARACLAERDECITSLEATCSSVQKLLAAT
jgi:hypothetical protein